MQSNVQTKVFPLYKQTRYFGPASVIETDECEGAVLVRPVDMSIETWARAAVPRPFRFDAGDEVLVAGDDMDNLYVIGVLTVKGDSSKKATVETKNGAYAAVAGEKVQVFSKRKELIFEYDTDSEKARIIKETGNLELVTKNGDILLNSGRNIQLTGTKIDMNAKRGIFNIEETRYTSKRVIGKIGSAKLVMERVERVANTVIEKAKNVYKTVYELSQLKTGRMRTLVDETYHIKTKNTIMKADEDFKANADKIYLG